MRFAPDDADFRHLVQSIRDYAIFLLDPEGRVASWNAGAQHIKGYRASEILGQHFSRFYPPDAIERGWPEHELEVARREGRFEDEGWRLRKDGSRFWANVVITALRDDDGTLRGFAKVTRDMTDRRRIAALEEEGRNTREFLAMLGHELRNPLGPILNAIALLRGDAPDPQTLQWARDLIERQAVQLVRLVDDLLELSRITTGKIRLARRPLDLRDVVADAVDAARVLAHPRHQTLDVARPDEPVRVEGDPARLTQVVVNLLNNAVRCTPEGGAIRVSVEACGSEAVIRVRDNGAGISPRALPTLFDLFEQGGPSSGRPQGALGVGLALVRRFVQLHGGEVSASSEGPGRGSEFVVRLPRLAEGDVPAQQAEPAPREARRRAPLRVLVVDDSDDAATSLALLLRRLGHTVEVRHDAATALAAAAAFHPELAILDLDLPDASGHELARRMRREPGLSSTVLVALSGFGSEWERAQSAKAGFAVHIVKPIPPAALEGLLDEWLPPRPAGEGGRRAGARIRRSRDSSTPRAG